MSTYYFPPVSLTGTKSGDCTVCGKKARRSRKFTNTVSPFNRNPDGTVRTTDEVRQHVRELVREWESEPVMHAGCESQ